jgi:hypothetical protein
LFENKNEFCLTFPQEFLKIFLENMKKETENHEKKIILFFRQGKKIFTFVFFIKRKSITFIKKINL